MGEARNSRGATVEAVVTVCKRPRDRSPKAGRERSRKGSGEEDEADWVRVCRVNARRLFPRKAKRKSVTGLVAVALLQKHHRTLKTVCIRVQWLDRDDYWEGRYREEPWDDNE